MSGNENLKTGPNQVIINVTAVNGITTKKYYINAYKRSEEEEISYNEEQHNNINTANEAIEKMNSDEGSDNVASLTENADITSENKETENKVFMIVGIVLAILVIGIVVIRIKRR